MTPKRKTSNNSNAPNKNQQKIKIAIYSVIGTIIVAIITGLINYFITRTQIKLPIKATQTAEAKLTPQLSPTAGLSTPDISTPFIPILPLETIQFDYDDSPLNHGWNFVEGTTYPTFEPINDSSVGKALKITASNDNFYAIDYELTPKTKVFGNFFEILVNYPDERSSFYAYVEMSNNHGETLSGWLKFKVGKEKALPSQKTTGEQEWLVYIYPEAFIDQNWVKMQVDLSEVVQETYGKDGWMFQKIIKFRIRGNLWIDSIEVSEVTVQ